MRLPPTAHDPVGEIPETARRRKWGRAAEFMTDAQMRGAMAAYYAGVSFMDDCIGRVLAALDELNLRRRTIVVYCSDHGEMLFEHGEVQKHNFYEAAVAVPLLIAAPGLVPAGVTCPAMTSLIDVLPTLLEMTGVSRPATLEGRSLLPALAGEPEPADRAVFAELYCKGAPERMIRLRHWKYVYTHGDIAQLYDLRADPLERCNLAHDPAHAAVCDAMKARVMDGWEFPPRDIKLSLRPGQPQRAW